MVTDKCEVQHMHAFFSGPAVLPTDSSPDRRYSCTHLLSPRDFAQSTHKSRHPCSKQARLVGHSADKLVRTQASPGTCWLYLLFMHLLLSLFSRAPGPRGPVQLVFSLSITPTGAGHHVPRAPVSLAVVELSEILPGTHVLSAPGQSPTLGQSGSSSFKSQSLKPWWTSFLADPPLLRPKNSLSCLFNDQGYPLPSPSP